MKKSSKKVLFFTGILVLVLFAEKYVTISFDRNSIYKANLPKQMRVAHYANNSQKDLYKNIYVDNRDVPSIGDNDVLVAVYSASFTERDFEFFKSNENKNKKEFVPCSDFSGRIVAVGKNVKKYEIGDKVFGIADLNNRDGACAEYVKVPQNNISVIPYSLTFKQAASIPTPALLNWFAVHSLEKKGKKKGIALVDDSMSEMGIMLTGLLVRSGFDVVAVDNKDVRNWAYGFGVKEFIDNDSFAQQKKEMSGKYDVVFNLRKGLSVNDLIGLVKKGGEFISFEKVEEKRNDIKIRVINYELIDANIFAKMARLVHLGKLSINVAREYNLEQIKDAYMRAEKGNLDGKVVVNIREDRKPLFSDLNI